MTKWTLDELKKIKAMPFPEGSAKQFEDRYPILYHNIRDKKGHLITGDILSPIPKEPNEACK
jgi:hypothetical protein